MRRLWLCIAAILGAAVSYHTASATAAHFFQNFIEARGGCGTVPSLNMMGVRSDLHEQLIVGRGGVALFGKPLLEWTEEDIATSARIYKDCWLRLSAMTAGPRDTPGLTGFSKGQISQFETVVRAVIAEAHDVENRRTAQQLARTELEKAKAQRKREDEEQEVQQRLVQAREQSERDRQAAEDARRRAEIEEPKIAEATKQAEEARREREAAERRLAEVRSRIDAQEQARKVANEQALAAEGARREQLQRQTELDEDARLSRKCTVSLEQFNNAQLGMGVRQVERLFGCRGVETSAYHTYNGDVVRTYSWDGKAARSNIALTFRDSLMESKRQFGLE